MRRGFIKQIASAGELQKIIAQFAAAGVDPDAIMIAPEFEQIYPFLGSGDVVVVQNYASISSSMNNFFDTIQAIVQRGVSIRSIDEPEVPIDTKTATVLRLVYKLSYELRKTSTKKGLENARAKGKTLGRPVGTRKMRTKVSQVDDLLQTAELSISEACRTVGCLPGTYYRLKREK